MSIFSSGWKNCTAITKIGGAFCVIGGSYLAGDAINLLMDGQAGDAALAGGTSALCYARTLLDVWADPERSRQQPNRKGASLGL
jgi:hypothetical protein